MKLKPNHIVTAEQRAKQESQAEQERINAEAREYLASTDWYVIRWHESGRDIPDEVVASRQAARDRIISV